MSSTTQQADLVTVTEAAKALGTSRGSVHYHRIYGRLPAVAVGGRYLIPREAVVKLRAERYAQDAEKAIARR